MFGSKVRYGMHRPHAYSFDSWKTPRLPPQSTRLMIIIFIIILLENYKNNNHTFHLLLFIYLFIICFLGWVGLGVVCFRGTRGKRREVMGFPVRFPGVSNELLKILDANMDEAPARRRAREAFKDIQLGIDHILFKVINFSNFFPFVSIMLFSCVHVLASAVLWFYHLWYRIFSFGFLNCWIEYRFSKSRSRWLFSVYCYLDIHIWFLFLMAIYCAAVAGWWNENKGGKLSYFIFLFVLLLLLLYASQFHFYQVWKLILSCG